MMCQYTPPVRYKITVIGAARVKPSINTRLQAYKYLFHVERACMA